MKLKLFGLILASVSFVSLAFTGAVSASADLFPICSTPAGGATAVCKDVNNQDSTSNPVIRTVKSIINIVSYAIGVAAIIIIIVSGLRMILASGDPKAVEQARSGILYALVGIAVAITAQAIIIFVLNKLA